MKPFELTHARHDPAHCLAPGLFRSLKRGDRKRLKLSVVYQSGSDRIEFSGPEPLGADDLRVLQGLVAMAAVCGTEGGGIVLPPTPATHEGKALRRLLEAESDAADQDALVVKGSFRQLAREIGYSDIEDARQLRECIERLWKVSIIVEREGRRMGFRILSCYASDSASGQLLVALNPRLTESILGDRQYFRIDLAEVRALKSDPARLMHQRLHWINAGQRKGVMLDTLCSYVWPDQANPDTMKKRRQVARKALAELSDIGWGVEEYAPGKFWICRPKSGTQESAQPSLPPRPTFPRPPANLPQTPG
ncbi:replication protein C, IncQ-type [Denitratisoma oestradiolicum]|uniref:DNA-binding protein-like protein n=1 Tax=Denitratisoma oestradiolicum TaxID=311182 RepID=A0A6S6YEL9_9PROT|nr:replication protein C, IncQ-type [Denitratisoma oestradiolicum]TWO80696.1 replication protein C [Denitratisoma oestradiolicum]CAB1371006.1 DNA-binding protein-like protein [Denitratisoma oestradiolicum]